MRRKREQSPLPWLRLFLSLTGAGVLGVAGYQVVNEAVNAGRHTAPAPYEAEDQTFSDLPELAGSLEEDGLFVPRFLLNEVPEMFVNTLPDICTQYGEPQNFHDLLAVTPEQTLQANGAGNQYGEYVFSVYANRTNCRDGQAEFRLSYNRGRETAERLIFSDDEAGRQAMLTFLEDRFRTLSKKDLPEFVYLRLSSSTLIPVRLLGELRQEHPEDAVSGELELLVSRLSSVRFDQTGIGNFRVLRRWSRAYFTNNFPISPESTIIEISFISQDADFFDRTIFLTRSGEGILLSGIESQSEVALDPALYPALYSFLGGEDAR